MSTNVQNFARATCKLIFLFMLSACFQSKEKKHERNTPKNIITDMMSWLYYQRDSIIWSSDYQPLDTMGKAISKLDFLNKLTTGAFFPLKITMGNPDTVYYKLERLHDTIDRNLKNVIGQEANTQLRFHKMEGSVLPTHHFVDMDNNLYDRKSTKNKILVLNCWFIRCTSCVAEFPKLNKLVDKYKNNPEVIFIALAPDSPADLKKFLQKKSFLYKTIPNQQAYLENELKIAAYPTHLIIGRNGKIIKVMDGDAANEVDNIINKVVKVSNEHT